MLVLSCFQFISHHTLPICDHALWKRVTFHGHGVKSDTLLLPLGYRIPQPKFNHHLSGARSAPNHQQSSSPIPSIFTAALIPLMSIMMNFTSIYTLPSTKNQLTLYLSCPAATQVVSQCWCWAPATGRLSIVEGGLECPGCGEQRVFHGDFEGGQPLKMNQKWRLKRIEVLNQWF